MAKTITSWRIDPLLLSLYREAAKKSGMPVIHFVEEAMLKHTKTFKQKELSKLRKLIDEQIKRKEFMLERRVRAQMNDYDHFIHNEMDHIIKWAAKNYRLLGTFNMQVVDRKIKQSRKLIAMMPLQVRKQQKEAIVQLQLLTEEHRLKACIVRYYKEERYKRGKSVEEP